MNLYHRDWNRPQDIWVLVADYRGNELLKKVGLSQKSCSRKQNANKLYLGSTALLLASEFLPGHVLGPDLDKLGDGSVGSE